MDIVLTTLNARYAHAAFGLRYLMANLGELRDRTDLLEFDINQRPLDIAEAILAKQPRIVGIGVYIWNVGPCTQLVSDLKRLCPKLTIIIGGPEVSHEPDQQEICARADYILAGEADLTFADLCRQLLNSRRPLIRHIASPEPRFEPTAAQPAVALPYHLYNEQDLKHRVIYVEASRGCPFECEFCLSSLEGSVRNVPLDQFLPAMQDLLDRGAMQFKFVDRTFNLNLKISQSILQFFLDRLRSGLFLHFEMIPDRLPEALRDLIRRFPPGALQFEVGVQTLNDDVARLISRRQDNAKLADNLKFLREETGVHVHADLIAGLPGEDLPSFAAGFDRLLAMGPQEIQLGILKRLRGTPIVRHDQEWEMVYSAAPPYEVLRTKLIDFETMQRLRRLAKYWDLIANSGNFPRTLPLIWANASPFQSFWQLSDWLHARLARDHAIALPALAEAIFEYLTAERALDPATVAQTLWNDYSNAGRRERPAFLRPWVEETTGQRAARASLPPRQARHLNPSGER